eukprot:CAMPEP_0198125316 /NCGR_PEP_ID=MMETSP1442-20131203/42312_1 /TAXON_ID= /ORGANISM="Craspedostauros australis, Strain CCMP3328" /LENGTH=268 /DNA_ID=CAMNT_0043784897 /DNA_START=87 /DNA_END=893 /DNA_ORIENTATION=+
MSWLVLWWLSQWLQVLTDRQIIPTAMAATATMAATPTGTTETSDEQAMPPDATPMTTNAEQDDRTLLDVFGEAAKEFLTQKLIPPTDTDCRWDWRFARCEPFCACAFAPQRGDYHLGRSCRRKTKVACDEPQDPTKVQALIQTTVVRSQRVLRSVSNTTRSGYRKVQESVCRELPQVDCTKETSVQVAWQQRLLCSEKIPKCPEESAPEGPIPPSPPTTPITTILMRSMDMGGDHGNDDDATANANANGDDGGIADKVDTASASGERE